MLSSGRLDPSQLSALQTNTEHIRNFCILAHVDHGKTTLSDSLVCSNGAISPRLAGKLRYLDSTEEEQSRGITMHSSAISLFFELERQQQQAQQPNASAAEPEVSPITPAPERYLMNLVDCPGHIDFSSDVSTATRLCDGALLVIDVLEGMCTQTHAVMHKALKERMTPCLVLNKIDRLCLEMKLTPVDAFHHLRRLLENVNALAYSLVSSELRAAAASTAGDRLASIDVSGDSRSLSAATPTADDLDPDHPLFQLWNFQPELGNVIFASAFDCWGFNLIKFAVMWSKKLGVNKSVLQKYLFENYSFNPKTKKIIKCDGGDGTDTGRPMFASMILDPIWQLYDTAVTKQDPDAAAKMASKGLGVELTKREINPRDPRSTVQSIFRRWLPLSDCVLRMIVKCVPAPTVGQANRLETLLPAYAQISALETSPTLSANSTADLNPWTIETKIKSVAGALQRCSSNVVEDEVVIFVSKLIPVKINELSPVDRAAYIARKQRQLEATDIPDVGAAVDARQQVDVTGDEVYVALARVFSGVLTRDTKLFVLNRDHDPRQVALDGNQFPDFHVLPPSVVTATEVPSGTCGVYMCLGPSIVPVEAGYAGSIIAIYGLDEFVLKTSTIASTWACAPLRAITFQAKPLVRVAVEPQNHADLTRLEAGLQLLFQYDPAVEVGVDRNGQHTVACLGELHLEQCIKALTEKFAKCQIVVSEPLVSYRETIYNVDNDPSNVYNSLPSSVITMNASNTCVIPAISRAISKLLASHSDVSDVNSTIAGSRGKASSRSSAQPAPSAAGSHVGVSPKLPPPWGETPGLENSNHGRYEMRTAGGHISVGFSAHPLSVSVVQLMLEHEGAIEALSEYMVQQGWRCKLSSLLDQTKTSAVDSIGEGDNLSIEREIHSDSIRFQSFLQRYLSALLDHTAPEESSGNRHSTEKLLLDRIVAFGSTSSMTNILLLAPELQVHIFSDESMIRGGIEVQEDDVAPFLSIPFSQDLCTNRGILPSAANSIAQSVWSRIHSAIVAGFQSTCSYGPLMQEPLYGVAISIDSIKVSVSATCTCSGFGIDELATRLGSSINVESSAETVAVPIYAGQLISEVIDALRICLLTSSLRVVEPFYSCDLQCDQSQLGALYGVLAKRRGDVVKEDVIEGTTLFVLTAAVPVAEAFGFAPELLKKTSGNATAPQLSFKGWKQMEMEPFWKPTTQQELEDHGEMASEPNLTRLVVDKVRKRKGLTVEEKVVASAEKQRTLAKKK